MKEIIVEVVMMSQKNNDGGDEMAMKAVRTEKLII